MTLFIVIAMVDDLVDFLKSEATAFETFQSVTVFITWIHAPTVKVFSFSSLTATAKENFNKLFRNLFKINPESIIYIETPTRPPSR